MSGERLQFGSEQLGQGTNLGLAPAGLLTRCRRGGGGGLRQERRGNMVPFERVVVSRNGNDDRKSSEAGGNECWSQKILTTTICYDFD